MFRRGGWAVRWVGGVGEFLLEDGQACLPPAGHFGQEIVPCESLEAGGQRGQHREDHTASLGSVGRLAGAGSFADFGFAVRISFAVIVRGLDRRT